MDGKHSGCLDDRDMFTQTVRAVREARPRAFVFENVQGLTRAAFADYFDYILLQLEFPSLTAKPKEQWGDHLTRLRKWKNKPGAVSEYRVTFKLVTAANYGVPQKRMRVFFVGFRADDDKLWTPPAETHSADALLLSQWASGGILGAAQGGHAPPAARPEGVKRKLRTLVDADYGANLLAWKTVREAICDLPDPERHPHKVQAHRFQPGALLCRPHRQSAGRAGEGVEGGRPRRTGRREHAAAHGWLGALFHRAQVGPHPDVPGHVPVRGHLVGGHAPARQRRTGAACVRDRRERL